MTTTDSTLDIPIRNRDDLLRIFHEAEKPRTMWRIGAEMEKFGVDQATGAPVHYDGARGISVILNALAERHAWAPVSEVAGGPVIALERGGASITLEPGSQFELSGAPAPSIHEISDELDEHLAELEPISQELGLIWLGLGFHPFARREDLTFVPKQRYGIMRSYLPTRGAHALDMMLRTATVQANFDYESEADAMRKMRVSLKLAPLTTALFANSPYYEGRNAQGKTYRGRVWLDVDPDRSGLVPALWSENATFNDYVEWALDAPMFLFKRNGAPIANTGQTFRRFWNDGFSGYTATLGDWQLHLNTLFPEVRLKRTIEVRGADSQTMRFACALPALWTGILYDERALSEADALTASFAHDEVAKLRETIWRDGLRASFHGRPIAELSAHLVEISERGLERRALRRADGKDERVYLAPLKALADKGLTPADELLEGLATGATSRAVIMSRARLVRGASV